MYSGVTILVYLFSICLTVLSKPHIDVPVASREAAEHFIHDAELHDVTFDHKAFLGSEAAKEYSRLTPDESREKLKEIFRKIDADHDDKVNVTEMQNWIMYIAKHSQNQVTDKRWSEVNPTGVSPLKWKDYIEASYGKEEDRLKDTENVDEYRKVVRQDRRRWEAADVDKDEAVTKEEFFNFLNPEDKPHMRDAIIDELLEAIDIDKDGRLSEKEYLDDLARAYQTPLSPDEPEPDWVEREREQFRKYRDADHDGFMNREEVAEWITPAEYDPVDAETQHLFYHADTNKDKVLTEKEILDKQDLFVSSQATNYGMVFGQREEL